MKSLAFVLTFIFGTAAGVGWVSATQAPPAPQKEDPPYRSLDANLYMQTSAEYRACCYQAFALAEMKLKEETAKPYGGPGRAVVLDLDETVLDNAAFQSTMIRLGLAYDQKLWDVWELQHDKDVGLIPGAKPFIEATKKMHVSIYYITNRNEKSRAETKAILERHGIDVPDENLLMATTTSDKTARRAKVNKTVVMLIGDNLRDFDERFKFDPAKGTEGRKKEVDETKSSFGTTWIILPNPAYGEWAKPLGKGTKDVDQLVPSIELKP